MTLKEFKEKVNSIDDKYNNYDVIFGECYPYMDVGDIFENCGIIELTMI